jgi:thiol-disulfide isomerase/thioredoxin
MTKFVSFHQGGESTSFFPKMSFLGGSSGVSSSTIFYIFLAFLFIILVIYLYYQYVKPATKANFTSNSEYNETGSGSGSGSGEAELMLFYADWCPHCKTAKPIWEELKSEYENKKINGYTVMFTDVNCTNESPEIESLMNKYKIEGFPTIKLLKNGQIIEYDAKPSKTTLVEFLNTAL